MSRLKELYSRNELVESGFRFAYIEISTPSYGDLGETSWSYKLPFELGAETCEKIAKEIVRDYVGMHLELLEKGVFPRASYSRDFTGSSICVSGVGVKFERDNRVIWL